MKNTAFLLFVIFFEITALLLAVPMEYKSFSLYRQAHADQKNGDVKKHDEVVQENDELMRSSTLSVSEGDRITMEEYAFVSQNHNSRGRKVLVIYCQKWLADRSVVRSTSDYMSDVLARGADRELVRIFEKSEENVLKAYQLSNHLLVLGWIQITEDLQRGVEDSIKEHNAKEDLEEQYEAHGDDAPETDKARDILDYWSCAVSSMKESARCQAAMLPQVSGIVDP